MATDGPDPTPCADDIYRDGKAICAIASISSNRMERFIRSVAESTRQRVDWHFVGGRAVVKVIGNTAKVRRHIAGRANEIARLQHASHVPWHGDATRTHTGAWRAAGRTYRTRELARISISRRDGRTAQVHWL